MVDMVDGKGKTKRSAFFGLARVVGGRIKVCL